MLCYHKIMGKTAGDGTEPTTLETEWRTMATGLGIPSDARRKISGGLEKLRAHHLPTYEHCMRVGILAARIGKVEGLPEKPLFYAGSMHDRGKLNVSPELLSKTARWTKPDAEALRHHPVTGYDMTLAEGMAVTAGVLVLHHTFQPDPYPEQLPEDGPRLPEQLQRKIRVLGRIVALADFYDAAHRLDRSERRSGGQIKDTVLSYNPDMAELVEELYAQGVFSTGNQQA